MELARVSAGYLEARSEIGAMLPPAVPETVRELVLRMSDSVAAAVRME